VRRWISDGKLRARRVVGGVRIESRDVDNLVTDGTLPAQERENNPDRKAQMEDMARQLGVKLVPMSPGEIRDALKSASWEREDVFQHRY
jgi:hypothetical protein